MWKRISLGVRYGALVLAGLNIFGIAWFADSLELRHILVHLLVVMSLVLLSLANGAWFTHGPGWACLFFSAVFGITGLCVQARGDLVIANGPDYGALLMRLAACACIIAMSVEALITRKRRQVLFGRVSKRAGP